MKEQAKTPEKLSEEHEWQLALAYLRRAEAAANVLRTVLFFSAIAVAALVLWQMKAGDMSRAFFVNVASVTFALVAVFCLVKSWQLQKQKALERFRYLKAGDQDAVALYDGVTIQVQGLQSRFWDWLAFWALAVAILIQLAVRVLAAVPSAPPPALPM